MQAIVKTALEPEWEARFEANSYGFRPGRSTMDAIEAIHTTLNQRTCSAWVLDADISGCFDNINHEALLQRLPVFTTTIRRWLKAGVVELGHYSNVEAGTPQGGIISPLLANIALDGMERLFGAETPDGTPIQPTKRKQPNKGINLIRYADDYVVTALTREVLESYVIPKLTEFLQARGLTMSEAKTRMVHVTEGFNFLGFTIRRFGRKLLTRPQKDKILKHLRNLKSYLQAHQQTTVGQVIRNLNPVMRGWVNYYRHCAAKTTFNYVQYRQWWMLWRWAKRRHPNKSTRWVKRRYYQDGHGWVLHSEGAEIFRPTTTPITRHVKVAGRSSPYDPCLRTYWQERNKRNLARQVYQKQLLTMLKEQGYRCAMCKMELAAVGDINVHHIKPRHAGGTNERENLQAVHHWCHHQHHQRSGYGVHKA